MPTKRKVKMLVLDDNPHDLELVERVCRASYTIDYEIIATLEPEFCIAEAVKNKGLIDICVIDLKLGLGESGLDVVKTFQTMKLDIPCIILTGAPESRGDRIDAACQPLCYSFHAKEFMLTPHLHNEIEWVITRYKHITSLNK